MSRYRLGAISVVVVNWNRRDFLKACLQSLKRQQINQPFEVVVVDNGSSDGSAEMVSREWGADPLVHVVLLQNRENRGFCAANNQGFAASDAEFVAVLNNDAEADPGWL